MDRELLRSTKNPHGANTDLARDRKKTSSIDRAHPNDGRLSNKKRDISALVIYDTTIDYIGTTSGRIFAG